jgi:hypothetical protein
MPTNPYQPPEGKHRSIVWRCATGGLIGGVVCGGVIFAVVGVVAAIHDERSPLRGALFLGILGSIIGLIIGPVAGLLSGSIVSSSPAARRYPKLAATGVGVIVGMAAYCIDAVIYEPRQLGPAWTPAFLVLNAIVASVVAIAFGMTKKA